MGNDLEHWRYRHNRALQDPEGPEVGIVLLRRAIGQYVIEAELAGANSPGEWRDYVLGPEVGKLLSAFRGLLNGEVGRLDAGTLDMWARGMADRIGYDLGTDRYGLPREPA